MIDKLVIDIMDSIAHLDQSKASFECNKKTYRFIKRLSDSLDTVPKILRVDGNRKYYILGIPLDINKNIPPGFIKVFPSGNSIRCFGGR